MASFGEKCPVCKIGKLSEAVEKKFLSKKVFYICDNSDCSAKFLERGNTAKLLSCEDNTFLDKYDNYLEKREWINIADGGLSDKEIKIQKDEEQKKMLVTISEGDMSLVRQIPQDEIPIILKKKELCYAMVQGAQFWEDRAVRKTGSGYGGFSFRVAKGVSFRVGQFGATGESHMERRHIDTGNLFVTSKRVVFVGSSKSIDFALNKVLSVEPFSDGIGVSRSNKQKTEYFVGGFDGLMIKAVIEGAIKNL